MGTSQPEKKTPSSRPARQPKLSVVAPCFNEEDNLATLIARVTACCTDVVGDDYEIVLVDDGSSDATWERIDAAAKQDPHIVGIELSRNFGHQIALTAGLEACSGERILVIDADLQDPPELLADMMKLADDGADVVYGQRRARPGDSMARRLAAAIFYRILRQLSDVDIPVDAGDFRLMSRRVLDVILSMPEHHRYIRGMVSWIGFKQVPIVYDRDIRKAGVTGYNLKRLLLFSMDAIMGFSVKPLHLVTMLGLIVVGCSMIFIACLIGLWLAGDIQVEGWVSLIASVFLMGGLNLMFMGIMGEYIGRIFAQSKGRPLYIVASRAGRPKVDK